MATTASTTREGSADAQTWLDRIAQWDAGEADRQIREGLPIDLAVRLQEILDLTDAETARLIDRSRSTYSRHRRSGAELTLSEAERVVRAMQAIALAAETFGSVDEAAAWVREENQALGGETPLTLLETGPGAAIVRDLLVGMQHGFPL